MNEPIDIQTIKDAPLPLMYCLGYSHAVYNFKFTIWDDDLEYIEGYLDGLERYWL